MTLRFKKVLAVGAHPDDIEYSSLGFLLMQQSGGASISVFVSSLGSIGDETSGQKRKLESDKSFKLNNFEVFYSENGVFDYAKTESEIRQLLLKNNFDCVVVHDPNDSHQEHRLIYEITSSAARRLSLSFIRYRSVSSNYNYRSNLYLGVDRFMKKKNETLELHVSQKDKPYMQKKSIEDFHTFYNVGDNKEKFYESFFIETLFN